MLTVSRVKNKIIREMHKMVVGNTRRGMSEHAVTTIVEDKKAKAIEEKKALAIKRKKDAPVINKLVKDFMDTMGTNEITNKEQKGFTLMEIQAHDYGCSAKIYAPYGMVLNDLEKLTPLIQTGCRCQFLYEIPEHKKYADVKFIHSEQVKINDWPFVPISVKPWQFCPGYGITGEPLIYDLNKMPQILLAGQQRRGKNGALDNAMVSWIHSCTEHEITFYLIQCAKNDLIKYKDCKQVYCYVTALKDILVAFDHLKKEMDRRIKLFEPMVGMGESKDNILHYNKLHPSNPLAYIMVVIDEFIELMSDSKVDSPDIVKIKGKILRRIQQMGQFGGSMGVNYLILHQKPSAALMPVFIKNQASVRVCFGFDDLTCSAIVLGDDLSKHAHKLPPRKAFVGSNDGNGFLYTPNLTGLIRKYIEPSITGHRRDLFEDLIKLETNKLKELEVVKEEAPIIDMGTVTVTSEEDNIREMNEINMLTEVENVIEETPYEIQIPLDYQMEPENLDDIEVSIPEGSLEYNNVDPENIELDADKFLEGMKKQIDWVTYNPK